MTTTTERIKPFNPPDWETSEFQPSNRPDHEFMAVASYNIVLPPGMLVRGQLLAYFNTGDHRTRGYALSDFRGSTALFAIDWEGRRLLPL